MSIRTAIVSKCLLTMAMPTRLRELKEAENEASMRSLDQLQLALSEVERTWWDSLPETDREHQARVHEILTQVQYSP